MPVPTVSPIPKRTKRSDVREPAGLLDQRGPHGEPTDGRRHHPDPDDPGRPLERPRDEGETAKHQRGADDVARQPVIPGEGSDARVEEGEATGGEDDPDRSDDGSRGRDREADDGDAGEDQRGRE